MKPQRFVYHKLEFPPTGTTSGISKSPKISHLAKDPRQMNMLIISVGPRGDPGSAERPGCTAQAGRLGGAGRRAVF